jgi:hypothetical protein
MLAVKRYRILAAAVVMQMCLGATYAWSVFVLPLKQATGILQSAAQPPFALFYLVKSDSMCFKQSFFHHKKQQNRCESGSHGLRLSRSSGFLRQFARDRLLQSRLHILKPVTRSSYGKKNENHRREHRSRPRGLCHERGGCALSDHPFVPHR